jgi:hypothetical protein
VESGSPVEVRNPLVRKWWRSIGLDVPTWLGLGAILSCLAADAALLKVGLDELDEGYFAEQAARVLRGELPYRDFDALYTPGLLYLHTALFTAAGRPDLVALRLVALLGRAALALGLFAVARELVSPQWAAVPALFVLVGLDTVPAGWEPHPGWESAAWTILGALIVARLPSVAASRHALWLGAAGATTGIVFLFKQNAGVFAALAAGLFLFVRGVDVAEVAVTRRVRVIQVVAAVVIVGLAGCLVLPHFDASVGLLVVSPLLAAMLGLLRRGRASPHGRGLLQQLRPLLPFGVGFAVLTVAWLTPLIVALEGRFELLAPFVGAVDQANLFFPLEVPAPAEWFTRPADESLVTSLMLGPERLGFGLVTLLPAVCAWGGAWLVRRTPPGDLEWRVQWCLLAGALALLTQYPRMDTFHLSWSAPLLLVVGVGAISRAPRTVRVTLLALATLAAAPAVYQRAGVLFEVDTESGLPGRTWLLPLEQPPMVAGFRVSATTAWQLRDLLDYLKRTTATGEPIFVYPSSPLVYVLADRPNPTRYSHVYPGMREHDARLLVDALELARVRTVVTSDAWLAFWDASAGYPLLDSYLADRFVDAERFGVYRVLRRVPQ